MLHEDIEEFCVFFQETTLKATVENAFTKQSIAINEMSKSFQRSPRF